MSYVPTAEYKAARGITSTKYDASIRRALVASADRIDLDTNRTFGPRVDAAGAQITKNPETALVFGAGTQYLQVPAYFGEIMVWRGTEEEASKLVDSDMYWEVPTYDRLSNFLLRLKRGSWAYDCPFLVKATFGCRTTPEQIKDLNIELTALDRIETPKSLIQDDEYSLEARRVTQETTAGIQAALRQYRIREI